jgi:hypothetical protein|nr:MAG TPA: hypothetical protein [Caudoviricetes sp.]
MSNLAKDWQEGTYVVSVSKNMVRASYPNSKTTKLSEAFIEAEARCAPEDEFSLSMGVALAMDRLSKELGKELGKDKIKVGDKVKIKNSSLSYSTYTTWIKKNINDVGLAACYVYGQIPKLDETEYIVKAIAPWYVGQGKDEGTMLVYIQRYYKFIDGKVNDNEPCYLIRIDGLEKV